MNETEIRQYITSTFEGVDVVDDMEAHFFFYNPDSNMPPDHRFPFATIVTSDLHDQFSNLNRPSVFRLNVGITKQTYLSLFGSPKSPSDTDSTPKNDANHSSYDFTALDQLMPHPVYAEYYWVCVLNPSDETLETLVRPLLVEGYELAIGRHDRREARTQSSTAQ